MMKTLSISRVELLIRAAAVMLLLCSILSRPAPTAAQASRSDLYGPEGSAWFGMNVFVLPNGNFVVYDPYFGNSPIHVGAVYLYDGDTHARISTTTGTRENDMVGSGGITILENGDFVLSSPRWNNGVMSMAGAVTFCSATSGCPGFITPANSLVGTHANDMVGTVWEVYTEIPTDTSSIIPLPGAAYLVPSPLWDNHKGALTYCDGSHSPGCLGEVSVANSLVGTTPKDLVRNGDQVGASVTVTPDGGYIVNIPHWRNGTFYEAGAVSLCPASGCTGLVSTSNSLYGDGVNRSVGQYITLLTGGGFVVASPDWGPQYPKQGAVTYCASLRDPHCLGQPVSASNSLVGRQWQSGLSCQAGCDGVTALPDGGYLIQTSHWYNAAAASVGALTYCAVRAGTSTCTGQTISAANSLTGDQSEDAVGYGVTLLTNGAFVVISSEWHNHIGAVTFCANPAACMGQTVSSTNSLVGANPSTIPNYTTGGDMVGNHGALALPDGAYAVFSPNWDPLGTNFEKGAVTFCPATGCSGIVSLSNSLTGSKAEDLVGIRGSVLPNGAVLIYSPFWGYGDQLRAGAVTYCATAEACEGVTVELSNSLVSNQAGTEVWSMPDIVLSNGAYLVYTPNWDSTASADAAINVGAVTWCPASGCQGVIISAENSLVGSHTADYVGLAADVGDNLYVVQTEDWQNGDILVAGAVTLCSQRTGCTGPITTENSVVGMAQGLPIPGSDWYRSFINYRYDAYHRQLLVGQPAENKVAFFRLAQMPPVSPVVSTGDASGITADSVVLHGMVNPREGSTTITFEYGLTTSYGQAITAAQSPLAGSTTTPVSAAITGLTPGKTYHYRVVAVNSGGTSYGEDLTFTTSAVVNCYPLTLSHTGSGSSPAASPASSAGCAAGQYVAGENIALRGATPDTSWQISGWNGTINNNSTASTNIVTMPDCAHTASVDYTPLAYTLTIVSEHGTVTKTPDQATYHYGDVVTLSAVASSGWTFRGWTPALTGSQVTIQGDTTITANYQQTEYALTIASSDSTSVYGQLVTFTATVTSTGIMPTGTVTFYDGEKVLGTVPLDGSMAAVSVATLGWGSHSITAAYEGEVGSFTGILTGGQVVSAAPITITADGLSKVYGETDPALTYQITSGVLVPGDTLVGSLTRAAGDHADTYAILQGTLTHTNNPNYSITFTGANFTIRKATLTVTADNKTKKHLEESPTLTYTITGLVRSDTFTVITGSPILSTPATKSSPVGVYSITIMAGTLHAANYQFDMVNGELVITANELHIFLPFIWMNESYSRQLFPAHWRGV